MNSENPISSRLKLARESKNLSIAELSKLTNIRMHIIQALDEGRLEELPKVYMRSFIKRYAQNVGIASAEIDELMNRHLAVEGISTGSTISSVVQSVSKQGIKAPVQVGASRRRSRWLMAIYSFLGVAALALLYYMYAPQNVKSTQQSTPAPSIIISDNDSNASSTGNSGGLMSYFGTTSADSLTLEAVTTDTVWISITTDGKVSEQVTLGPNQTKKWMALEKFVLSVGNAGGVVLRRNGTNLPAIGKLGETVRSIRITKSEYVTSASPWKSQRDSVRTKVSTGSVQSKTQTPPPVVPANTKLSSSPQVQKLPAKLEQSAKQLSKSSGQNPSNGGSVIPPGNPKANPLNSAPKDAVRKPQQSKAELQDIAARKRRLERIKQEAKRPELTPVKIKP